MENSNVPAAPDQQIAARRRMLTRALDDCVYHPTPAALETLQTLLREESIPAPDDETPLIIGVMRCAAPAVLRMLIELGTDPDQCRTDGTPAIIIAARLGDHAAVDVLLQAGADVDASDTQGRTALMHAVERGQSRTVGVLLHAGAAIDAVSADGMTALELARGWQRQRMEFMLGRNRAGLDNVPINRTALRLTATAVRMTCDPRMFKVLASVIDIAMDDLGEREWSTRTGIEGQAALAFAERLREGGSPASTASWHELDATSEEVGCARAALVELAYGTTRTMPEGFSRLQIVDLLEELNRELKR
ncbi:ankyrin repeat domain-containing protein [Actinospica robiniae]|uniref:ankyrin repeat domain-containing protein n=1 Tax=Actinospica robiniae TaxID=304901 RepID=UPI00146FB9D4|nr:ankyrin repeat domain-containing protein [Actinospica robiniae]